MKTIEEIALELLPDSRLKEHLWFKGTRPIEKDVAIDFAKQFLAAYLEQQEPVAWCYVQSGYTHYTDDKRDWYDAPGIEEVTPIFLAPPPAVPEGYVLVPKEPSEEMCAEGCLKVGALYGHHGARSMYQAMIAAAPKGEQE